MEASSVGVSTKKWGDEAPELIAAAEAGHVVCCLYCISDHLYCIIANLHWIIIQYKNKTNHPISSNNHPSATANKAIHCLNELEEVKRPNLTLAFGWMDGWMDGRAGGQTDGRTAWQKFNNRQRRIQHLKSDLINNMDRLRIFFTDSHQWSLAKQSSLKGRKVMPQKCLNKLKPNKRWWCNKPTKSQFQSRFNTENFDVLKTLQINRSRP